MRLPLPASPVRAGRRDLSGAARWLDGRLLTLVAGACAAIPVIVSTIHAIQYHWQPTDDKAIIATRAWDVLTGHTPLLGQFSTISELTPHAAYTLGPMQYWLIAIAARWGAPLSMAITEGAVNTACVIGAVALARRRGGKPLMFGAAAAIALMCMSLASESFHDTWNSAAPLFPFLLLLFVCWSVAVGEYRLLPLAVLLASFVVQCHLSYLAPASGLIAIALAGLAVTLGVRHGRGEDGPGRGSLVRWGAAALLVAALCWTPTIVDQVSRRPGNLSVVANFATASNPKLGSTVAWHAVVRAVGLPPWWLYVPKTRWDRYADVRAHNGGWRTASAIVVLALLLLIAVVAALRRRGEVLVAAVIGLVLCAAVWLVAAQTPASPPDLPPTVAYTLWWASHVGMWVYLVLAWSAWLALASVLPPVGRRLHDLWQGRSRWLTAQRVRGGAAVGLSALGIAAVATAGGAVAATAKRDQHIEIYKPIAQISTALERAIPSYQTIRFEGSLDGPSSPIKPAIRWVLVRRDIRVLSVGSRQRLGNWYELLNRPYNMTLWVFNSPRPPAPDASLVIHVAFTDPYGHHDVYLWLSRRPGAGERVSARRALGRSVRTRQPRLL